MEYIHFSDVFLVSLHNSLALIIYLVQIQVYGCKAYYII